jgi:hypothetical protein
MPATNNDFPWMGHYGRYDYFERAIAEHSKVLGFEKEEEYLFAVALNDGRKLRVFICDCYSFDVADFEEVMAEVDAVDIIVINSNWCGYSNTAKSHSIKHKKGLFKYGEFLGAINYKKFWEYTPPEK